MKQLKIWGFVQTIFKNTKCQVDFLYVRKNTVCSLHLHNNKYNRFFLLQGEVEIIINSQIYNLKKGEIFDVEPQIVHQFKGLKNSFMLEISFVNDDNLNLNDIQRLSQGGEFINNEFLTLDQLKEKNLKEYQDYE